MLAALLLLPLGALRLPAQTATASIHGIVRDPSGAVVPHAKIYAVMTEGSSIEGAVSADDGSYHIDAIRPGRYRIEVMAPGFAVYQHAEMALVAGKAMNIDAELNVGSVSESFEVLGKRPASAVLAAQLTPQRIRVGGMVQASKLLTQSPPTYPETAMQMGIEGTVVLRAVIGTDGRLLSLSPAGASSDPDLTKAALAAVQQWIYEPTRLNGEPVEVATTIAVTFRLQ
jgi:TonB family protein